MLWRLQHLGLYPSDRCAPAATVWASAAVAGGCYVASFWIVEEGLNGRTTVWDDPLEPFRSGKELLVPCLLTHQPIDLVIVFAGEHTVHRWEVDPQRGWPLPAHELIVTSRSRNGSYT